MGGSSVLAVNDPDFSSSRNDVKTLVLFGRTGNGKSATGNSILGKKVFKSKKSSSGVTTSCEMKTTVMSDGQKVNVIDTPGLFDLSTNNEFVGKEIVKCIGLAKEGIHAIIIVLSVGTRFSVEEESAIRGLETLFGSQITDYMIVVFTGGDVLKNDGLTLDQYLGPNRPEYLKTIISLCENGCLLFDNTIKDKKKRFEQIRQLLSLVNRVLSKNDGRPYTNELFIELKVKSKVKDATRMLEQQLAQEQQARLNAEKKLNDEIKKLKKDLADAREDNSWCVIV